MNRHLHFACYVTDKLPSIYRSSGSGRDKYFVNGYSLNAEIKYVFIFVIFNIKLKKIIQQNLEKI